MSLVLIMFAVFIHQADQCYIAYNSLLNIPLSPLH